MITKRIIPDGWPCSLSECPPGHFIPLDYPNSLCFKPEYDSVGAFNEAGEYYHGKGWVQPVVMEVIK